MTYELIRESWALQLARNFVNAADDAAQRHAHDRLNHYCARHGLSMEAMLMEAAAPISAFPEPGLNADGGIAELRDRDGRDA